MDQVNQRLEKYYDNLFIDEIQDFGGHDFNLLRSIVKSKVNMLFVGDFYQHTFDTSRDGNVNKNLYDNVASYKKQLDEMGLVVDSDTLKKSYRCSPTICRFISQGLGIGMDSNRDDETLMHVFNTEDDAKQVLKCNETVKLFYKEHYKYNCYSKNWGDSKGADHYKDVCVVMTKDSFQKLQKKQLYDLKPQTRNKLYVACTRAKNDLYLIPENLCR